MPVKLCGRKLRVRKPIRVYEMTRRMTLPLMLLFAFAAFLSAPAAAHGAEFAPPPVKPPSLMAESAESRTQTRTAIYMPAAENARQAVSAPSSVPALAIALALGLRNAHGPLEKTALPAGGPDAVQ
ncbi:MAG: hypothetical protein WC989_06770 [Micavibrio sp.]